MTENTDNKAKRPRGNPAWRKAVPQSGDHHWQKGVSGNPAGKPKGCRHKTTIALQALLDGEAESRTRTCINLAKTGDSTALRLLMERLIPPARERLLSIDLPKVASVGDIPAALGSVLEDVASGAIPPAEGGARCGMLGAVSKAFETAELAQRLAAIERQLSLGPPHDG